MTEVFKPRINMKYEEKWVGWICRDGDGNFINDGGPSLIYTNGQWYFYDHHRGYHRIDGPATSSGYWFINDRNVTKEIHAFAEENNIDLDNLSDEDKVLIALKFG